MGRTRILKRAIGGPWGDYRSGDADVYMQPAGPANKNYCVGTRQNLIIAHNTGEVAHNITITSYPDPYGRPQDIAYELGAGKLAAFGPFGVTGWRQPDRRHYLEADSAEVYFGAVALERGADACFLRLIYGSGYLVYSEADAILIILEEKMALVHDIQTVSGTKSAAGDNTLIAAPGAGKRIVITFLLIQNKSTTSSTAKLLFDTTQKRELLAPYDGVGLTEEFFPFYWLTGGANEPLILNLSDAVEWTYSVDYFVEDV